MKALCLQRAGKLGHLRSQSELTMTFWLDDSPLHLRWAQLRRSARLPMRLLDRSAPLPAAPPQHLKSTAAQPDISTKWPLQIGGMASISCRSPTDTPHNRSAQRPAPRVQTRAFEDTPRSRFKSRLNGRGVTAHGPRWKQTQRVTQPRRAWAKAGSDDRWHNNSAIYPKALTQHGQAPQHGLGGLQRSGSALTPTHGDACGLESSRQAGPRDRRALKTATAGTDQPSR